MLSQSLGGPSLSCHPIFEMKMDSVTYLRLHFGLPERAQAGWGEDPERLLDHGVEHRQLVDVSQAQLPAQRKTKHETDRGSYDHVLMQIDV